jgi:hypothetical protein
LILNQRRAQATSKHDFAEAIASPSHLLLFAFLGNNPPRDKFLLFRVVSALNQAKFCNDSIDHN